LTPFKIKNVTLEILLDFLSYDKSRGCLIWKAAPPKYFKNGACAFLWNTDHCGNPVPLPRNPNGYVKFSFCGQDFPLHRLVWAVVNGDWPSQNLDHINGQECDNRIENLREATTTVNNRNQKLHINNKSGANGVYVTESGKYSAALLGNHLGTFESIEEAVSARKTAEREAGAFTERHGLPKVKEVPIRGYSLRRKFAKQFRQEPANVG
jgi:hypothetical protein